MENEGAHDEETDDEGAHEAGNPSLHMRPQPPYAPSFCEGAHGASDACEGAHGAGNGQAAPDIDAATPPEEVIYSGYNISRMPKDRQPPKPGELSCVVRIREIRRPAISAGPNDSLDDFVAL
jgi:hypothetical protein